MEKENFAQDARIRYPEKKSPEWYRTKMSSRQTKKKKQHLSVENNQGILKIKRVEGNRNRSGHLAKSNSASELAPHLLHHTLLVKVRVPYGLAAIRWRKFSQSQGVFFSCGRSRGAGRVGAKVWPSEGHFESHLTVSRKPLWDCLGPGQPGRLASLQEN